MRARGFVPLFCILCFCTLLTSCQLILEPAPKAIERLFAGFAQGYDQPIRDLTEQNTDLRPLLQQAAGIIASEWYNAQEGFYTITSMEKVQDTGTVFVYVDVTIPRSSQDPYLTTWSFEMERTKLRWHILAITGIEEFIRRAQQERGIL